MAAAFLPVVPGSHDIVLWGVNMVMNDYFVLMKRPRESAKGSGIFAPFNTEVNITAVYSYIIVNMFPYFKIVYLDYTYQHTSQGKLSWAKYYLVRSCHKMVVGP